MGHSHEKSAFYGHKGLNIRKRSKFPDIYSM